MEQTETEETAQFTIKLHDIQSINATIGALIGQSIMLNGGKLSDDLKVYLKTLLADIPEAKVSPPKMTVSTKINIGNSVDTLENFMNDHVKITGNKIGIRCSDLRDRYNQSTGNNVSHVIFSRMMDEYSAGLDINKIQRQNGRYYTGIEWSDGIVKIPERYIK